MLHVVLLPDNLLIFRNRQSLCENLYSYEFSGTVFARSTTSIGILFGFSSISQLLRTKNGRRLSSVKKENEKTKQEFKKPILSKYMLITFLRRHSLNKEIIPVQNL
ncbi:hypothetical protein HHI36_015941 [Cryptolaemus montrouzieri]|uniref:Uncharacterized protein n=1 Tax=Cryptolaemus montrouzieri TaxID=559131 RepID=A0ABD2N703_9CUCU